MKSSGSNERLSRDKKSQAKSEVIIAYSRRLLPALQGPETGQRHAGLGGPHQNRRLWHVQGEHV